MKINSSYAKSVVLDTFESFTKIQDEFLINAYDYQSFYGNNYAFILDESTPLLFYQAGHVNFIEVYFHLTLAGVIESDLMGFEKWFHQFFYFNKKDCKLQFNKNQMLGAAAKILTKISKTNNFCAYLDQEYCQTLPRDGAKKNYSFLQAVLNTLGKDFIEGLILETGVEQLIGMETEGHPLHFLQYNNSACKALVNYHSALKMKDLLDNSNFSHKFLLEKDKLSFIDIEKGGYTVCRNWFRAETVLNIAEESRIIHARSNR